MKKLVVAAVFLLCASFIFSGDIAQYINLGFSSNSKYFMFGQYGISSEETKAFAETYIVDVSKNVFIKDGISSRVFQEEILPGQEGLGALFTIMEESMSIISKTGINHIATGRVVYLLVNGAKPKERLEFRDFYKDDAYTVTLVQESFGSDDNISSSFHVNLSVTDKSERIRTYTIGLPDYKRKDVLAYRIKQVVFTPSEEGLVFVIEKEISGSQGKSIRYMVETLVF
jgi:predicted secreted protein